MRRRVGFRRSLLPLVGILAAAALCAYVAGGVNRETRAGAHPGWTEYRSTERGFSVEYPASWERADSPMFPPIINPKSILAVSTFVIPRGAGRGECGYVPSQVRDGVGRAGAAILLAELYGPSPNLLRRTRSRPEAFHLDSSHLQRMPGPSNEWLFNFKVRDRFLTAAVVLGPQASPQLRRDVVAMLHSLRFDPRPRGGRGWPAAPRSGSPTRCC
jgi:hypothetical protein